MADYNATEIDRLVREGMTDSNGFAGEFVFESDNDDKLSYRPRDDAGRDEIVVIADSLDSHVAEPMTRMLNRHRDLIAALSAAKAECERLRASLSLAQTREQQATEMCTWLTGENQRLRDVVALSEHLDADIDEVLADAEDDCVSRVIAENEVTRLAAEVERLTKQKDGAYNERDRCVAAMAALAVRLGFNCWLAKHPPDPSWDADWTTIVFMNLPVGQVSWHIHDSEVALFSFLEWDDNKWDGHTTEQKYRHLEALGDGARPYGAFESAIAADRDAQAAEIARLSARVRELELTEEEREALRVAGDWLMRLHEVPSSDADPALAVLDRLVKGGR